MAIHTNRSKGGGGAVPAPFEATTDGGENLRVGAPAVSGAGRDVTIHAQPSTDDVGGTLYLGAGGRVGNPYAEAGSVVLGHLLDVATFIRSMSVARGRIELFGEVVGDGVGGPFLTVSNENDPIQILTFAENDANRQEHVISYGTDLATALGGGFIAGFRWFERFSDVDADAISYAYLTGLEAREAITVRSRSGLSNQPSILRELTTATVTATLIYSYPIGQGWNVSITVLATADNGSTCGEVVKKAVFRRTAVDNSGNATQQGGGATFDASVTAFKLGHDVTIALNGNAIEVKVVAASSGSTVWVAAISIVTRYGAT